MQMKQIQIELQIPPAEKKNLKLQQIELKWDTIPTYIHLLLPNSKIIWRITHAMHSNRFLSRSKCNSTKTKTKHHCWLQAEQMQQRRKQFAWISKERDYNHSEIKRIIELITLIISRRRPPYIQCRMQNANRERERERAGMFEAWMEWKSK